MTQSPATLPPGIVDSCNNAFVVQLKAPKDRDLMMAHLALSEKGFVDEHPRRHISRMEAARSIVKLGYSRDKRDVPPILAEALMASVRVTGSAPNPAVGETHPPKVTGKAATPGFDRTLSPEYNACCSPPVTPERKTVVGKDHR